MTARNSLKVPAEMVQLEALINARIAHIDEQNNGYDADAGRRQGLDEARSLIIRACIEANSEPK